MLEKLKEIPKKYFAIAAVILITSIIALKSKKEEKTGRRKLK